MKVSDLTQEEYDPYYSRYINVVPVASELRLQFEVGMLEVIQFFKFAPEDKLDYRYAQGKWTIKEILQHLIDTERIFMYRIFRIARND
ncbi:MAG: DinB family protein, partial [Cyclobacteriaceae bacterium]